MPKPPTIHCWPTCGRQLVAADGLLLVTVNTKNTPIRESARLAVRQALTAVLPPVLGVPGVTICSLPGQPPYLAERPEIGLSISHESGLSLFAIDLNGPVGVDLLDRTTLPETLEERYRLCHDYLGSSIAEEIAALPATQQSQRFALAWVAREAQLKCLGLGLDEWQEKTAASQPLCRITTLSLASGHLAAVARR